MPRSDPLAGVLKQLERTGTTQNRKVKVYARHGIGSAMFGASIANQKRLAKTIGIDQRLAEQLRGTGNQDARILATMIAETWRLASSSRVMIADSGGSSSENP